MRNHVRELLRAAFQFLPRRPRPDPLCGELRPLSALPADVLCVPGIQTRRTRISVNTSFVIHYSLTGKQGASFFIPEGDSGLRLGEKLRVLVQRLVNLNRHKHKDMMEWVN